MKPFYLIQEILICKEVLPVVLLDKGLEIFPTNLGLERFGIENKQSLSKKSQNRS